MFIAIIGTPSSGKSSLLSYLIEKHGFKRVRLAEPAGTMDAAEITSNELDVPINKLSVSDSEPSTPNVTKALERSNNDGDGADLTFPSSAVMLEYITKNWLSNLVTTDLRRYEDIDPFVKRPFFLLVAVDGPLSVRYLREKEKNAITENNESHVLSLEDFVEQHDTLLNGHLPSASTSASASSSIASHPQTDFKRTLSLAQIHICNNFPTLQDLWAYLDQLDLLDAERLRPGWDTYFMTLASLASHRSNCMKRRVGAVLVRSKRILSTGYNGTPRGTRNCNQGGCKRCNGSARGGEAPDANVSSQQGTAMCSKSFKLTVLYPLSTLAVNECLCLHAEENALLEAGRDRIGDDSVLYCNTCPCLRCSVKIVQTGVREVVYNQSYSMDEASAVILKEGGVILRQLLLPSAI